MSIRGNFGPTAEAQAPPLRDGRQPHRELMHAPVDEPDAAMLDVGDQHERRRGWAGRGASIGRTAPEQLAQARVAKVPAQRLPGRGVGVDGQHAAGSFAADPADQAQGLVLLLLMKGPFNVR